MSLGAALFHAVELCTPKAWRWSTDGASCLLHAETSMGAMKKIWLGLSGEKLAGGLKVDKAHGDRVVDPPPSDSR